MKNTITLLLITCSSFIFAQESTTEHKQFLEKLKIEITLDSFDDIKDINISDIKSIFNQSKSDQPLEFNVHCNNSNILSTQLKSNLSIKIDGNSNDLEAFYKQILTIKKNIKKYYNNQKSNK